MNCLNQLDYHNSSRERVPQSAGLVRTGQRARGKAPRRVPRISACLLGAVFTACSPVGPDYQRPDTAMPDRWHEAGPPPAAPSEAAGAAWWKAFGDPVLNRLIREAMLANLDLKQTYTRIRAAREQRLVAIANGLPILSNKESVSRRLNNAGQSGAGGQPGGIGFGNNIDIFQLGFDVQWEIDLFGGIRRSIEAAEANLEAEVENSRAVLVTLLGDIARAYIEMRSNQHLLNVSQANLKLQLETARLMRIRYQAGLSDSLEAVQAEALAAQTQAQLPVYETARKQAIHQIELLLGKPPGALQPLLDPERPVPSAPDRMLLDLPSELLRRRPDIRLAERQLAAATAQVGVATADLYPRFNIAAFLGFQNMKITDVTALSKSWSAAGTLTTPIFNWGRIRANIDAKEAQQEQSFLAYQSAVLGALRDVENSLVAYAQEKDRRAALEQAVESNRLALKLSKERYRSGLTSFLNVLDSERAVYSAESDLVRSQASVAADLVSLYKALGGGWETALIEPGKWAGGS
ncbi:MULTISPECIES: efflux transporter outer membrane subunit [Methylococcus]|uniref:efflux transporter outer membrane subunit n=1 Tax=Methylococcus TaxID=413 RepID=UPI001E5FBCB8|nr:efflux transporter outer membrane subunit [Methylococcus sp. BF19-07]